MECLEKVPTTTECSSRKLSQVFCFKFLFPLPSVSPNPCYFQYQICPLGLPLFRLANLLHNFSSLMAICSQLHASTVFLILSILSLVSDLSPVFSFSKADNSQGVASNGSDRMIMDLTYQLRVTCMSSRAERSCLWSYRSSREFALK